MAKGKIHHWKHGWIPLDAFARAQVAKRQGKTTFKLTDAPTVEEHVKTVRRRTAAEKVGEPPKRTRKPPNWVPPADNKPKWNPPSDAAKVAMTKKALAKDQKISDAALMRKNYSDMSPAEKIRAAEIMYGANSPKAKAARKTIMAKVMADVDAAEPQADKDAAARRAATYRKVDTVDGVEFVAYKSSAYDPLGSDHGEAWEMDEAQKQVVADAYNEVKAEFPKMQPIQIVATQGKEGILGITTWDGRRISLSKNAFDDKQRQIAHENFGDHGAIAGQFTDDPEAFARATVVHEMGHALEMQTATAKRRGDAIATERVTAADIGLEGHSGETRQRWMVDTLNDQTVYGTGNQFEWFAEAFAEGWFNGENATPQSKRVLAMLHDVYGGAKLGRIPIPKSGGFVQKGVVTPR